MGQLQLIVVTLPPLSTAANIHEDLKSVIPSNGVRIADALFVLKDASGEVSTKSPEFERDSLTPGGLLRQLLECHLDSVSHCADQTYLSSSEGLLGDYGLDLEDIDQLIDRLPHDTSNLFLLVEELWSAELRRLVRTRGGVTLASGVISQAALEHFR